MTARIELLENDIRRAAEHKKRTRLEYDNDPTWYKYNTFEIYSRILWRLEKQLVEYKSN